MCYIQYYDKKTFDTIALNCAVDDLQNTKDNYGKLTALVLYNTNYFHTNSTKRVQIEFGLSKEVSGDAIIGIPTLKMES